MNRVLIWGNIGKDPELRMSAGGTAVLKFSVATSERRKDQSGNWTEETEWHAVVCFGKRAEGLGSFLSKGASVLVEGKLRTTSWDDKTSGHKRYKTEIVADEVKVTSKKGDRASAPARSPAPAPVSDEFDGVLGDDSDIPF
jgi:single-strand DNA-binding protein